MKDAECADTNDKSIFRFFRFLIFLVMVEMALLKMPDTFPFSPKGKPPSPFFPRKKGGFFSPFPLFPIPPQFLPWWLVHYSLPDILPPLTGKGDVPPPFFSPPPLMGRLLFQQPPFTPQPALIGRLTPHLSISSVHTKTFLQYIFSFIIFQLFLFFYYIF